MQLVDDPISVAIPLHNAVIKPAFPAPGHMYNMKACCDDCHAADATVFLLADTGEH